MQFRADRWDRKEKKGFYGKRLFISKFTFKKRSMSKLKKQIKYSEADLIEAFNLKRVRGNSAHPLMDEWTSAEPLLFSDFDTALFEIALADALENIEGWNEEELKMRFISLVIRLGKLTEAAQCHTYFERVISANVEDIFLLTKTDFMLAKGILDKPQKPYFHFQEYKKLIAPNDSPVPQLLEAFLIAQNINNNDKPIYGCTVIGKFWDFYILENRTYLISKTYDCTDRQDLMQIVAMLRKFKDILENRLLD